MAGFTSARAVPYTRLDGSRRDGQKVSTIVFSAVSYHNAQASRKLLRPTYPQPQPVAHLITNHTCATHRLTCRCQGSGRVDIQIVEIALHCGKGFCNHGCNIPSVCRTSGSGFRFSTQRSGTLSAMNSKQPPPRAPGAPDAPTTGSSPPHSPAGSLPDGDPGSAPPPLHPSPSSERNSRTPWFYATFSVSRPKHNVLSNCA
jgi:hypothetical protein